jgi:hypothetical protein
MKPSRIIRFARFAGGSGSSSHARFSDIYSKSMGQKFKEGFTIQHTVFFITFGSF